MRKIEKYRNFYFGHKLKFVKLDGYLWIFIPKKDLQNPNQSHLITYDKYQIRNQDSQCLGWQSFFRF